LVVNNNYLHLQNFMQSVEPRMCLIASAKGPNYGALRIKKSKISNHKK
jgi:hypothetical protein